MQSESTVRNARPISLSDGGDFWGLSTELHQFLIELEALIQSSTSLKGEELAQARVRLCERVATVRESIEEMCGRG